MDPSLITGNPVVGFVLITLMVGVIGYLFWSKQKGNRGGVTGLDGTVYDNVIEMAVDERLKPFIDDTKKSIEETVDENVLPILAELRKDIEPIILKIVTELGADYASVKIAVEKKIVELEAMAKETISKK